MPLDLTVIILTKNESIHIGRALDNLKGLAQRVVVADSYSTDDTIEIALAKGAEVIQNKFVNYAKQFQWALESAKVTSKWVMRLDADELIESDLREELERTLPNISDEIAGINLKRKHIFMGRWVRHGGRYPLILLRIWRNGQGRIEDRWMDEHMVIWGGRVITLDGGFSDHNLNDLTFFTAKHNGYATREAIDVLIQRRKIVDRDDCLNKDATSIQAAVKRIIKESVYNKLPYPVGATLYFIWRYIFQLGFLDGKTGLIYHFLQGYWYRFLVGAKLLELETAIGRAEGDEALEIIYDATGYRLR